MELSKGDSILDHMESHKNGKKYTIVLYLIKS